MQRYFPAHLQENYGLSFTHCGLCNIGDFILILVVDIVDIVDIMNVVLAWVISDDLVIRDFKCSLNTEINKAQLHDDSKGLFGRYGNALRRIWFYNGLHNGQCWSKMAISHNGGARLTNHIFLSLWRTSYKTKLIDLFVLFKYMNSIKDGLALGL